MLTILKKNLPYLKALIGLALLAFVLLWVDWSTAFERLGEAKVCWLLLGLGVVFVGLLLKALRWGLLLHHFGVKVAPREVLEAYMAGQALNILLPFRGGEVVRFGLLSIAAPGQAPESASTIVLEKGLDGLAVSVLAGILLLTLPAAPVSPAMAQVLPQAGVLLISLLVLFMILFSVWPAIYRWLRKRYAGRWAGLLTRADEIAKRWRVWLKSPRQVTPVIALTLLIWLIMWATNLVIFQSVELNQGGIAAGMVLALIMVGLLPALMPANIGPFHFFATLALRPFGVPVEQGMAFAILLHAVVTLPTLLIGGAILLLPGRRPRLSDAANI